jgi:hypothetical protein
VPDNPLNTVQKVVEQLESDAKYNGALRRPSPDKFYSMYISYAWKDKEADIFNLLDNIKNKDGLSKKERTAYMRELIINSGKQVPDNEDLDWIYNSKENEKGQTIEEWYHGLPASGNNDDAKMKLLYNREEVVKILEEKLKENGIRVFKDKNEMTYGDSIDSFMNRIGTGKAVLRVVSDKYLKSRYCMDEALRIHKYAGNDKRVFTLILKDDVDIDLADGESIRYKQYWQNVTETIFGKLDSAFSSQIDRDREKMNYGVYIHIYDYIMGFIGEIKDELRLELNNSDDARGISIRQSKRIEEQLPKIDSFIQVIKSKLLK